MCVWLDRLTGLLAKTVNRLNTNRDRGAKERWCRNQQVPNWRELAGKENKPSRPKGTDQWVLVSTPSYSNRLLRNRVTQKDSDDHRSLLEIVADEMFAAFQDILETHLGAIHTRLLAPPRDLKLKGFQPSCSTCMRLVLGSTRMGCISRTFPDIKSDRNARVRAYVCTDAPPTSPPVVKVAHRWGSAFPTHKTVDDEKEFLSDESVHLYACGDFCAPCAGMDDHCKFR
eukprot:1183982-Prorocentrum_minimum.AAC.2